MLKMSREKDTAKKSRSSNFGKAEIELLCNLLLKYSKVIESKKSDAFTWKEKVEIWNKLTSEFNSKNNGFPRTMISLKSKYETMKKEVRKKIANNKQELYKTGGGTAKPNPLTPVEEIIYNLIYLSAVGLSARYDDDSEYYSSKYSCIFRIVFRKLEFKNTLKVKFYIYYLNSVAGF